MTYQMAGLSIIAIAGSYLFIAMRQDTASLRFAWMMIALTQAITGFLWMRL
jgi:hypothetical protein